MSEAEPGPFAGRADLKLVVEGVNGLMQMPSAGDLVIYGGKTSFISEHGAHAGPSADEMQTFIIGPPGVALPAAVTHPVQLYDYFARYAAGAGQSCRIFSGREAFR
ncbi:MAG TPA: hypothetical protein VE935_15200 [Burkholderiales bacterium]|nr:hypothetical protein [Burkholderiales bacterium]